MLEKSPAVPMIQQPNLNKERPKQLPVLAPFLKSRALQYKHLETKLFQELYRGEDPLVKLL